MSSFLLFIQVASEAAWMNIAWLVMVSIIYYISFTMYLIPYNVLIAELGHHSDDRMKISSVISITWICYRFFSLYIEGILVENHVYGYTGAFQTLVASYSVLAFLCMIVSVLFLNEHKYAQQTEETGDSISGLSHFVKLIRTNKNLRVFVFSDLTYWLSATFIQMGIAYYITILMDKNQGESSIFLE